MSIYVVVAIVVFVVLCVALIFNELIKARNIVAQAWSDIDVQLKRRHDLVPGLVDCVKGYSGHEKEALISVTKLRAQSGGGRASVDRLAGENALSDQLKTIMATVERYPDLKANDLVRDLQKQLVETEDVIQYARRYYNGAVRDFNTRVESFPDILVAKPFGFKPASFFEIETASERSAPSADLQSP